MTFWQVIINLSKNLYQINMPKQGIISIHLGQPGVQIGSAVWELFCLEHGVRPDGYLYQDCQWYDEYDSIFSQNCQSKITPRALMVDLEPNVVDEIRVGAYRDLFAPDLLLTGITDASSNYARGYYSLGPDMLETAMEGIRLVAEDCPMLQGVSVYRGLGGGTGSGFASLLMENIADEFPKKCKLMFSIHPSPHISSNTTGIYNTLLSTNASTAYEDCSVLMENEAMYHMMDILNAPHATYTNVNRLIAQVVSSVTASLRFEGPLHSDLLKFNTNLLPFPCIHYTTVAYAPLISGDNCKCEELEMPSVIELTIQSFENYNLFLICDFTKGKYISCCMFFRGEVCPTDINYAIYLIKSNRIAEFVHWCPTGFKISICYQPPTIIPVGDLAATPRSVCMMINNSAIRRVWATDLKKFNTLFENRSFVHHYLKEGMEECEFSEATESITNLIENYYNIES